MNMIAIAERIQASDRLEIRPYTFVGVKFKNSFFKKSSNSSQKPELVK